MKDSLHIRWMVRRDMPKVLDIENQCFEFAWTEDDFVRCLRQRNCIGLVAEVNDTTVGFVIYNLERRALDVLSMAIEPKYQRSGIGSAMIQKLASKLSEERRNRIRGTVRESNLGAQLFLRSQGFRAIDVLHSHYEDSAEDAYVMQYRVGSRCEVSR